MPEVVDTLRPAQEPRAENDVGAAIDDRFKKLFVVAWIVFEVGILHQHDVTGDFGEATTKGGAFALIVGLKKNTNITEFDGLAAIKCRRLGFSGGPQLG